MGTTELSAGPPSVDAGPPQRSRDAVGTRRSLLQAARRRFARDGYRDTTVRDIAADAGVNVALINRYFTSKEGLFEACLTDVAEQVARPDGQPRHLNQTIATMIGQVLEAPSGERGLQLLLLLRSSGDDRADQIRRATLESFAARLAEVGGWRPGDGDDGPLLRAQIAIASVLGVVLLRSSTAIEPLKSATGQNLTDPLTGVLTELLG